MTQQYYYSSLTGQQLDTALGQIPQAVTAAAAAEASAQAANQHAQAAKNHAQAAAETAAGIDGYSKEESDNRFAPAILLKKEGSVLPLPWAAQRPLQSLALFGITHQEGTPTPDTPVSLPAAPMPRVILAGQNLWNNENAVIEAGGSCWSATQTGFSFRRGDYDGTGCVYMPVAIPKGSTLHFRCDISGDFVSCTLYGNGIYNDRLANNGKGRYSFTADRDYPNAVASVSLTGITGDVDISNISLGFTENAAFTPALPLRILETGVPLYGIPMQAVCQKHNYTDANGQKWFTDEIDVARGVYIQRCFTLTFDGTEDWKKASDGKLQIGSAQIPELEKFDIATNEPDNGQCCYHRCSHFLSVPRSGSRPDGSLNSYGGANGNTLQFRFDAYTGNIDGWKAWLAEQAAAGTPVTVLLGRKTPVETKLPDEVLNGLRTLVLREGENLLYNDASTVMRLSYMADTGPYLEAKLAQLSAAILQ